MTRHVVFGTGQGYSYTPDVAAGLATLEPQPGHREGLAPPRGPGAHDPTDHRARLRRPRVTSRAPWRRGAPRCGPSAW